MVRSQPKGCSIGTTVVLETAAVPIRKRFWDSCRSSSPPPLSDRLPNHAIDLSDMALYKSPVAGTKKVRLGASTCVSALPSELVGILLENAAMLGPDYIVDRQEVREWGGRTSSFL